LCAKTAHIQEHENVFHYHMVRQNTMGVKVKM